MTAQPKKNGLSLTLKKLEIILILMYVNCIVDEFKIMNPPLLAYKKRVNHQKLKFDSMQKYLCPKKLPKIESKSV